MCFLNPGDFIREAIESVIGQTLTCWELILVDDGSTDHSVAVVTEYFRAMPERIRMVRHPNGEHRGLGASRNLGLVSARGQYVAFLDADDIYLPVRLARHVELLDADPGLDAVQSCVEYWHSWQAGVTPRIGDSPEPAPPVSTDVPLRPPMLLLLMLASRGATVPAVCSITIRRELIARLGGFEASFPAIYEDQVLLCKLYLGSVVLVLDERLARYRQHPESMLHRLTAAGLYTPGWPDAYHRAFIDWLRHYLQESGVADPLIWHALEREALPYTHPVRWRLRAWPSAALRKLRAAAEALLPSRAVAPVVRWWGRRKVAASARRAVRQSARIAAELGRRAGHH
jgi:glycosyltransferase involved in cell wall biosynthesis